MTILNAILFGLERNEKVYLHKVIKNFITKLIYIKKIQPVME